MEKITRKHSGAHFNGANEQKDKSRISCTLALAGSRKHVSFGF